MVSSSRQSPRARPLLRAGHALLLLLAGCASIDLSAAAEIDAASLPRHDTSVALEVESHAEESGLTGTQEGLEEMLRTAIESRALFRAVTPDAPYRLGFLLRSSRAADQASGDARHEVVADWSLVERTTGACLWKARIATIDERTFSDHFAYLARVRGAAIGAYRKNLEQGFHALARSGVLPSKPPDPSPTSRESPR